MGKLIAVNQIMYKGKQYLPGEELPADDIELVQAWKRAGSVKELPEKNTEAVCDVARDSEEDSVKEGKRKK